MLVLSHIDFYERHLTHLSNPVHVMIGFSSFKLLQISSLTSGVAVAVNAMIGI